MTNCPYCREELALHCAARVFCEWRRCGRCKATFDTERFRAFDTKGPLDWPHTKPTAE